MKDKPDTARTYAVPDDVRAFVIGDIHGYFNSLVMMLEEIDRHIEEKPTDKKIHIYFLGDYIDRGPNSRGVLDLLIAEKNKQDGRERFFMEGNHEDMVNAVFHNYGEDTPMKIFVRTWLKNGGDDVIKEYKAPSIPEFYLNFPDEHREFIQNLSLCETLGDYFMSHAGINPHRPLDQQFRGDLLWGNKDFLQDQPPGEKMIIHGHWTSPGPQEKPHRIGIDTGIYKPGGGLTCLVLDGTSREYLHVPTIKAYPPEPDFIA